jgi:hypothetical protein
MCCYLSYNWRDFLYRTEKKAIQAILLVWALVTILASPLVPAHGLYQINKEQVDYLSLDFRRED